MKRITSLLMLLVCCLASAQAQMVASTPTLPSEMTDGYYVLVMRTADSRTDNTNGNFIYYDGKADKNVHFDEASAADHDLRGTTLEQDDFKYVFCVTKSDITVSIKAYGTNYYWPAIPAAQKNTEGCNPANQLDFVVSENPANFNYNMVDEWFYLSCSANKYTKSGTLFVRWTESQVTATVNVNDETHRIGYWESAGDNKCHFQMYAVSDMPEPGQLTTVTYNLRYYGALKGTVTETSARVGREYPEVDLTGMPDFLTAIKPAGLVPAEGGTYDIEMQENLPFRPSTDDAPVYYYLESAQGSGTRLYANGGLQFRAAAQAGTINSVWDDLWYVTGNVFDGFQFHSVNADNILCSSAVLAHTEGTTYVQIGAGASYYTDTWDVFATGSDMSICPHNGSQYFEGLFPPYPGVDDSNKREYAWKLNGTKVNFLTYDASDAAFAFRLVEPTFDFPMYDGQDGNVYNTFSAPFAVQLADADGEVKMYKGLLNEEQKSLSLTEVSAVPANGGIMLMGKGSSADKVTFKVVSHAGELTDNSLVGFSFEVADLGDKLILGQSDQTGIVGFYAAREGEKLQANHACLERTSAVSEVKSFLLDGVPTSIGRVDDARQNAQDETIYDLTGMRVQRIQKGCLYIRGGRKFIAQ